MRPARPREPKGSNGIALAGRITANGHSLLLINPHTSFYFRSELQMTSDTGLHVYGAATWGQFFIYQGGTRRPAGCTPPAASTMSMNLPRRWRCAGRALLQIWCGMAGDEGGADHRALPPARWGHGHA
jgi:hypothetical protein